MDAMNTILCLVPAGQACRSSKNKSEVNNDIRRFLHTVLHNENVGSINSIAQIIIAE